MKRNVSTINGDSALSELVKRYISHASTIHSVATIGTETSATNDFVAFFGNIKVREVTPERADAWRISLLQRFKQNTARTRLCLLKSLYHYALSIGIVTQDPFAKVKLPKMVFTGRIVADRILRAFLLEFPNKMRRALRLILNTGMRKTEAVMLDWSEVQGNKIVLPPHRTKNRKGRTIFLNAAALRCLGPRPTSGTGRVFDFCPSYLNKFATKAWRKLGIGRFRIHDLRHCAATRYSEVNHDDAAMLITFGWANEESAKPYRHITHLRERENMAKLTYDI